MENNSCRKDGNNLFSPSRYRRGSNPPAPKGPKPIPPPNPPPTRADRALAELAVVTRHPEDYILINTEDKTVWRGTTDGRWVRA